MYTTRGIKKHMTHDGCRDACDVSTRKVSAEYSQVLLAVVVGISRY
jgi:hypothetical protein